MDPLSPDKRALIALRTLKNEIEELKAERIEPIAIVGMGCRFPGGASSPAAFWELLRNGTDAISEVPKDRWDVDALYHPDVEHPGTMVTRWGGFIDRLDDFDAAFFEISPREAEMLDPQQRLLLEIAVEALDGVTLPSPNQIGAFVGASTNDYGWFGTCAEEAGIEAHTALGALNTFLANRLSYALDFRGPSVVVDTACSSALVALHLACRSLRAGEIDCALAGGVNALSAPNFSIMMSKVKALSPDGRCKTFDASANGYVRGEGCGIVVLKRLRDARRDGDHVWAVVRGTATNADGRNAGPTIPNAESQAEVIRRALLDGAISPNAVQYVEAHGTGTSLGDPLEVTALGEALHDGSRPSAERICALGSVKTNIGHLEAAAGIAGIIKTVLAIHHRAIPPSLHFKNPNPHIPFASLPFRVQRELGPWPHAEQPLIAGINSFGLGGTNAHAIVSEPPTTESADEYAAADALSREAKQLPLCLSAKTDAALREAAERLAKHLEHPSSAEVTWRDVAYTSCVRRTHLERRAVFIGSSVEDWRSQLLALANGTSPPPPSSLSSADASVVFVFSGQGTQWWGMGRELLERGGIFRDTIDECEKCLRAHVSWSLIEELQRDERTSRLSRTDIAQPALLAVQMGLVRLLKSAGIEPSVVVGHSVGEIAAACTAEKLTLAEASMIAAVRGRVMHKATGTGKMASVRLSAEAAETFVRDYGEALVVGAYNGPESVVLSGDGAAVDAAVVKLGAAGVETRELKVDYAFHSRQMEPFMRELGDSLSSLTPSPGGRIRMVSTAVVADGAEPRCDAAYWVRQMRAPVQFAPAVRRLMEEEHALFLEVGPHPALVSAMDEIASALGKRQVVRLIPTLRRREDQERCALEALAAIHCAGYAVSWNSLFSIRGRLAPLPTYPWQHQHYARSKTRKKARGETPFSLIQRHFASSERAGRDVMEMELHLTSESDQAYLADHKVRGGIWLPGAAFLEMALEAGTILFEGKNVRVNKMKLTQALILTASESVLVQMIVQREGADEAEFRIVSRSAKDGAGQWVEHGSGRLQIVDADPSSKDGRRSSLADAQRACTDELSSADLYEDFRSAGLEYGDSFQGIAQAWRGTNQALSRLRPLDELVGKTTGGGGGRHVLHPTLVDATFQTVMVAVGGNAGSTTYVPTEIGELRFARPSGANTKLEWAHVRVRERTAKTIHCDLWMFDDEGRVVVELKDFRATALGGGVSKHDAWTFDLAWRVKDAKATTLDESSREQKNEGLWLVVADRQRRLATSLAKWIEASGRAKNVIIVEPGDEALGGATSSSSPQGVVDLSALDATDDESTSLLEKLAHLTKAIVGMNWSAPPRLFVVTRRCQAVTGSKDVASPLQALVWGFGTSLMQELPELKTTLVDLDRDTTAEELGRELFTADDESRVAIRSGKRHVARLSRHVLSEHKSSSGGGGIARSITTEGASAEGYALQVVERGRLDSLTLEPAIIKRPGRTQVVIKTKASGVNFRDVLMAIGMYPGLGEEERTPMGSECAGVVHSVGEDVRSVRVGDAVVATCVHAFDAFVVTDETLTVRKPEVLSFEQAASLPSVVTTVLYALERVGRLRRGERVLIHAATGGVGLAAVQYAKHVGAEIYATAGSEEKRRYLQETLNVERVYDSRTLEWADAIKRATDGRGVDVVLNSLAGDAIQKGLEILAPFGRFLELGKRDIYENTSLGLYALRNNITMSAIALDQLAVERPAESRELLEQTFRMLESGAVQPLPITCFSITQAHEAFEHLARARQIGKVVIRAETNVEVRDNTRPSRIAADGTYLVTGGLGGLGLVVAARLAKLGARHIALLGRKGPSETAMSVASALEREGVRVYFLRGDVADVVALKAALAELSHHHHAPTLKGVVHAAGVLDDATVSNLTANQIKRVLSPKVDGAFALDLALGDQGDDDGIPLLRIYFSSIAGVLGSPGQAHYAAANAFLDAYAHHHAAHNRPALSVDWGAWSEVGLAARADRAENIARQGLGVITPEDGGDLFERVLSSPGAQIAVVPIDFRQWQRSNPQLARTPFFEELVSALPTAAQGKKKNVLEQMRDAPSPAERIEIVESYLRKTIASILRSSEDVQPGAAFKQLGFDSLMTVSLKNTLEHDTGLPISSAVLFTHSSIERLASHLASRVVVASAGSGSSSDADRPPAAGARFVRGGAEDEFPLTDVQQAYLIGRDAQMPLAGSCYFYVEVDWIDLDVDKLSRVVNRIVADHPMLRASFHLTPARQRIASKATLTIERLSANEHESTAEAAARIRSSRAHETLDAGQAPLLQVAALSLSERTTRLFVHVDLLILDLTSMFRFGELVLAGYWDNEGGVVVGQPSGHFSEYVRWREWRQKTDAYARAKSYWHQRVDQLPSGPDIPTLSVERGTFENRTLRIPARDWKRVRELARQYEVTPSAVLLTIYAHVLARWSSSSHFTVALTVFDAPPPLLEATNVLGDFTSISLLEVNTGELLTHPLHEAIRRVDHQMTVDLDHAEFSGIEVLREVARRRGGESFLFAPFVFTSALGGSGSGGQKFRTNEKISVPFSLSGTPQVLIDHQTAEFDGELIVRWDALGAAFPPNVLTDLWDTYVEQLLRLVDEETWRAPLVIRPQRTQAIWSKYNETRGAFSGALLHAALLQQLQSGQKGSATAVITPSASVSYGDLERISRGVVERLPALRRGTLVPVVMSKGWEQVAATLGILSAGGAYVPIDASLPPQRIKALLSQISATSVVTQPAHAELVEALEVPNRVVIDKSMSASPSVSLNRSSASPSSPNDVAYVIFTSGSTGTPKGVVIEHGAVSNTIEDLNQRIQLTEADTVFGISSLSFDLSVYDVFGTLGVGAKLVLPSPEHLLDPVHWLTLCERHRVTVWNSVPALAQLLHDAFVQSSGSKSSIAFPPIRLFLLSGDWIPLTLAPALKRSFASASVLSMGGATEASIWSIAFDVHDIDPSWRSVPYGRPMRNQKFFVLNEKLELAPEMVIGELFIGGVGLAREYLGDEVKTTRSFFRHPLTGERLYRTGDFGRMLASGDIEFLGRRDGQVKLHGNRIELGEVEAALLSCEGVNEAAARIHDFDGSKQLIGYVVVVGEADPDDDKILSAARARLPAYMVPARLVRMARLPLTSNAKVDRSALPAPTANVSSAATTSTTTTTTTRSVEPDGELEATVRKTYQQILGRSLSETDNFFSLGGDSLRAVQIALGLRKTLGAPLNGRDILQHPTVRAIARLIASHNQRSSSSKARANDNPVSSSSPSRHPVSQTQAHILDAYRTNAERAAECPVYHVALELTLRLEQPFSLDALRKALDVIVESEPAIRSSFVHSQSGWQQIVHERMTIPIDLIDGKRSSDECMKELLGAPFTAEKAPLLRVFVAMTEREDDKTLRLYWVHHHAILDGWSNWTLLPRLLSLYESSRAGRALPTTRSSGEAIVAQAEYVALESRMPKRAPNLMAMSPRPPGTRFGYTTTKIDLEPVRRWASKKGVLLQAALVDAYAAEVMASLSTKYKADEPTSLSVAYVTNGRSAEMKDADVACGFFWRYGIVTADGSTPTSIRGVHQALVALDGSVDAPPPPLESSRWIPGFNFVHFHHAIAATDKLVGLRLEQIVVFDRYAFPIYMAIGVLEAGLATLMLYSDEALLDASERAQFIHRLRARLEASIANS